MKIDLPADLAKLVNEKVDAGLHGDPVEVVADALELMHDRDAKERIKATRLLQALEAGLKDIAEGRFEAFETREDLEGFFKAL